jgi:hypothetical protein
VAQPTLNLSGPNLTAAIAKAADDGASADADAAKGSNAVALGFAQQPDGSGAAELIVDRTWTNGWDITAYAKAWWNGATTITMANTTAGVKVSKKF